MKKIFLLTLVLAWTTTLIAQEHVQWRGDNRDGHYPDKDLLTQWPESGPELLWVYEGIGDGHSSAAVTSERVYTAGTIDGLGYVYAFDHSGKLLWNTGIGKSWTDNWNGVRTTPMLFDGKIYIISSFGNMVCMNASDGKIIWNEDLFKKFNGRNIKWGITENLLIDDGKLFVTLGGEKTNVIALNPEDGKIIWSCAGKGEKSAYNSPAVFSHGGMKLLVTQTERYIMGIDASNGELLWTHEHINEWSVHPNTPIYHEGQVYCVSGYGKGGVALTLSADGRSITEAWSNTTLDNQMGGVVLADGRLYGAGHSNRKLICLDWKTGEELYTTRDFQRGNTIMADGLLYCYDERGKVGLVMPEDSAFKVISSFEVPYGENQHWAHLVIHNKKLYVRHGNALMVYNIANN